MRAGGRELLPPAILATVVRVGILASGLDRWSARGPWFSADPVHQARPPARAVREVRPWQGAAWRLDGCPECEVGEVGHARKPDPRHHQANVFGTRVAAEQRERNKYGQPHGDKPDDDSYQPGHNFPRNRCA